MALRRTASGALLSCGNDEWIAHLTLEFDDLTPGHATPEQAVSSHLKWSRSILAELEPERIERPISAHESELTDTGGTVFVGYPSTADASAYQAIFKVVQWRSQWYLEAASGCDSALAEGGLQ